MRGLISCVLLLLFVCACDLGEDNTRRRAEIPAPSTSPPQAAPQNEEAPCFGVDVAAGFAALGVASGHVLSDANESGDSCIFENSDGRRLVAISVGDANEVDAQSTPAGQSLSALIAGAQGVQGDADSVFARSDFLQIPSQGMVLSLPIYLRGFGDAGAGDIGFVLDEQFALARFDGVSEADARQFVAVALAPAAPFLVAP